LTGEYIGAMLLPPLYPGKGAIFYIALKTLMLSILNASLINLCLTFRTSRLLLQAEKFFYLKK
jgi:hypothetical protein